MERTELIDDTSLYVINAEAGIIVSTPHDFQPAAAPTMPNDDSSLGDKVEYWGDNNDFPQQVIDLYSKNTLIPTTLKDKASELLGGGLIAMQVKGANEDGVEIMEYINDTEIQEFLSQPPLERALFEAAMDLQWFYNGFLELIPNVSRSKIVSVTHQEAAFCRWEKQKNGVCHKVWLAAAWPNPKEADINKIDAIDPYAWNSVDIIRKHTAKRFMYPLTFPSAGKRIYQLAHHDAIRTSGWLEIVQKIPAFKKYLMANQMSIKYHFRIDEAYWPLTVGEARWDKMKPLDKLKYKQTWLEEMNKKLTDVEATGKSIMSPRVLDKITGQKEVRDYIIIDPIADPIKDGQYIEDVTEGSAQILYALGEDPTVRGFMGGAKMGARSGGSDKREAFSISAIRNAPERRALLEPIRWIANYNGWTKKYPSLRIVTKSQLLTTLDTGAGTKEFSTQ